MVVVGLAITVLPIVEFNPVDGDQTYEFAPLAKSVVDSPAHILSVPVTLNTGNGFTLIVV